MVEADFRVLLDDGSDVAVRPMRDQSEEYQILARWLTDDRVLEWIYGRDNPYPLERVLAKYRSRVLRETDVRVCLIEHGGTTVGFIQYFPVREISDVESYGLTEGAGVWGLDMWIGEPELWSQGIGSKALRLVIDYLFARDDAVKLVIDPRIDNPRAVRAYEKAGFHRARILPGHELHEGLQRDAWLMEMP